MCDYHQAVSTISKHFRTTDLGLRNLPLQTEDFWWSLDWEPILYGYSETKLESRHRRQPPCLQIWEKLGRGDQRIRTWLIVEG
jgi:hypothetical protein